MDDFKEINKHFELSEFFTITSGKFEFADDEMTKLLSAPTHRTATEKNFEDLYLCLIEKRKINPEAVESFRNVLKDEIKELILFEKQKDIGKDRKDYNLIGLAENFVKWLKDSENFTYEIGLPDTMVTTIAILRRMGVIDFIRKKNPNTNTFNIAKIIKKIVNTKVSVHTIAQYLARDTDIKTNPFRDNQRISEIDQELKKLNISHFIDDNLPN